ncbi:outer membrane efflux protein [bacterium BMS3Abin08]|nr:outer membrane efflux protein [bacterium BMS3Abin08]
MRMIWIIRTTIALVSVFFLSGLVDASETIHLTVGEAVRMAIRENIGLKAERYLPLISMGDVLIEESAFDPDISLSLGESYERAMSPSIVTSTRQRSFDLDISLSGRVDAGTRYTVKWNYQKFRGDSSFLIINPYHLTELTVTVSQPLLKGFGRKNQRTMIAVAEGNKRISGYRLKGKMEETALKTINAYYNVLIAEERLNYARFSLRLAEDVREEVKAKIGAGVLSPVEVYKAESGVAKREEMVLKAGNGLKDAIDELRLLLGIRDWRREIVLSGEEEFSDGLPDIEASITKVLKYSNEIKQALLEKKNREMLQRFYLNQMLPDVELFGTVGVSGLSDTRADALDRLLKGADRTWQVGGLTTDAVVQEG